jgi:hypothetical protein
MAETAIVGAPCLERSGVMGRDNFDVAGDAEITRFATLRTHERLRLPQTPASKSAVFEELNVESLAKQTNHTCTEPR